MIQKVGHVKPPELSEESVARAESLLTAASLLLVRGSQLRAAGVLHAEIAKVLLLEPPPRISAERRDAEELQRQLLDVLRRSRAGAFCSTLREPFRHATGLSKLSRRWPLLASWVTVFAVVGGLSVRYGYALLQLARWQREHPDGPWISRYYPTRKLKGIPVVRYDVAVDYDWGSAAPAQTLPRDYWGARWDTCIVVATDVVLPLSLVADDGATLMLDDTVLLRARRLERTTAEVLLRAGSRHLRVDYQDGMARAKLQLQGLDFTGTGSYHFQRPVFDHDELRCEPESTPAPDGLSRGATGVQ